ncbi:MAG: hypothetical protein IJ761_00130 [Bacteroidales bacterium]|nr:hypothetical protein [Bacteroidales bacterium]
MQIQCPSYLCDSNDLLHTWAAVRLCQEVTEYHGNVTGIGFEELKAKNMAWVISRAYYEVWRRPHAFEELILSTWSRGSNGVFGFRDYLMKTTKGETLLAGTSYWPLIDFTTRHAVRLNNIVDNYENHPETACNVTKIKRLKPPTDAKAVMIDTKHVANSMLDHTQHVNNSEYIRWAFDKCDIQQAGKPYSLEVNFNLESRIGEQLSLCDYSYNNSHLFCINNPRGVSALMQISDIN